MLALVTTSAIIESMTKPRAHVEHVSAADYDALLPQRLPGDALGEQQPFSLLVREHSRSPDAFRIVINAIGLRRQFGLVAFKMVVLDQDFIPASHPIDSAIGPDNMWSGDLSLQARGRVFRAPNGFIMPYEDIDQQSLLDAFETLGAPR